MSDGMCPAMGLSGVGWSLVSLVSRGVMCAGGRDITNIVEVDMGRAGAGFLNGRLLGGGSVSRMVAEMVVPVTSAFAPLPAGLAGGGAVGFDTGGVAQLGRSLAWLGGYLARRGFAGEGFCLVLEDGWAVASDVVGRAPDRGALLIDGALCFGLSGEHFDTAALAALWRAVASFDYAGFVIAGRLPAGAGPVLRVSRHDARALLAGVRLVLVSAFDREGFVVSPVAVRGGGAASHSLPRR